MKLKLSINSLLILPFVLQLFGAIAVVGYLSYRSAQDSVNDVAQQLREAVSNRIREELEDYTTFPHALNRINASEVREGTIDIDGVRGERQFWEQMRNFSTISYIYCGTERGAFMGVTRLAGERDKLYLQYSNPATGFARRLFLLDAQGNRARSLPPPNLATFDPRKRPWYIAAKGKQEPVWSPIYLDFSTLLPTVTASYGVYDHENRFIGVCATDFYLPKEMSAFLQQLKIGSGTAFIVEGDGRLVASSGTEPITKGTGRNTVRLFTSETPGAKIRLTSEFLLAEFGSFANITDSKKLDFELKGERQFVQVIPFTNHNLRWWIVLTVPEAEFMGRVQANLRHTLFLTVAAVIIALGIGVITAGRIARPIAKLTEATKVVATGNLDQPIQDSAITELHTLGESFSHMRDSLKTHIQELQVTTAAQQKIESDLEIARQIQLSLLPKIDLTKPQDNRYDICGFLQPARKVGGDFYDFFLLDPDHLVVAIGDVAGKGIPAALTVSRCLTLIRTIAKTLQIRNTEHLLQLINYELAHNNDECVFATLFCGILELPKGNFMYSSAGHDNPILIRDHTVEFLPLETGIPLGLEADDAFPIFETTLQPHDIVLLYTDGITEAMNPQEEFFTDTRLLLLLKDHLPTTTIQTLEVVEQGHQEFIQGAEQSDDLTLLAVQYQPNS